MKFSSPQLYPITLRTPSPRFPTRCPSAFTLIEVLLAVVVFAIVLSSIHLLFYGALRLRNTTSRSIESRLPLEQTLTILQRDLANIVPPGGTLFGPLQTTPNNNNNQSNQNQIALSPTLGFGSSALAQISPTFYTSTGLIADSQPWSEISRVFYFLADPTNNLTAGKDLFRSVTRNLLPTVQEQPQDQFLMSGLQSILFYFFDGIQWRQEWDSTTESTKLPQAIKVQLQFAPPNNEPAPPAPIQLVIPLLVQAGTNSTPQTSGGEQ